MFCTTCNSKWITVDFLFVFLASSLSLHNESMLNYAVAHTVHAYDWQILMLQTATLRRVEHRLIFYGANIRNTCSIYDCDTFWKVLGAEIICKYRRNIVRKY